MLKRDKYYENYHKMVSVISYKNDLRLNLIRYNHKLEYLSSLSIKSYKKNHIILLFRLPIILDSLLTNLFYWQNPCFIFYLKVDDTLVLDYNLFLNILSQLSLSL